MIVNSHEALQMRLLSYLAILFKYAIYKHLQCESSLLNLSHSLSLCDINIFLSEGKSVTQTSGLAYKFHHLI